MQGIRVPEPPELQEEYPDKNPAELINLQREIYGCKFDWKTGSVIVSYKEAQLDVTSEAMEIVANTASKNKVDLLGFDDKGFDFPYLKTIIIKNVIKRKSRIKVKNIKRMHKQTN